MELLFRLLQVGVSAVQCHLRRYRYRWVGSCFLIVALGATVYASALRAPSNFVPDTVLVIPEGASARDTAVLLAQAHVIRSATLFRYALLTLDLSKGVQAGAYRFNNRAGLFTVLHRVTRGDFGISAARITFFEGMTVRDMAERVAKAFPQISESDFISTAGPYEGYLFPDTYTFPPSSSAASITNLLRTTFSEKTAPLQQASTTHSFHDIVIVASLVEREARTPADKRMIAGILWNRIAKGMPLQVDAVFGYIFGRDTYSPSFADLSVDSPYNTYTHTGLPPGPIDNPGLDSLNAAAYPTPSPYLFYLTDRSGVMHYSKTYSGHLANTRVYLSSN